MRLSTVTFPCWYSTVVKKKATLKTEEDGHDPAALDAFDH